jgi:IclR family pca regulon transcriptional regulator
MKQVKAKPLPVVSEAPFDERYIVPGLSRGLALLQLFRRDKPEQKLTEIAEGLGLSRSATYRLVYTLERDQFLRRDPATRRYRLAAKVLSLGFEFLNAEPLTDIAQPHLRRLSDLTRSVAHLVIRDRGQVVYVARVAPPVTLVTNLQIGARLPAHITATGRILLAFLSEEELRAAYQQIKADPDVTQKPVSLEALRTTAKADLSRGYVFNRSTFDQSVYSLACPVCDRAGHAVAAVNVVAPLSTIENLGGEAKLFREVAAAATAISEQIGFERA